MKNTLIITAICIMLFACGSKKTYKYEDAQTPEVTEMKKKLSALEQLPGQEDEKKAMRLNVATAELGNLTSYEMKVRTEFFDKNGRKMNDEELSEFKGQIQYDAHVKELEAIIEKNK